MTAGYDNMLKEIKDEQPKTLQLYEEMQKNVMNELKTMISDMEKSRLQDQYDKDYFNEKVALIDDMWEHKDDYKEAKAYTALASLTSADGNYLGDAIVLVRPKGKLEKGKIIYVASSLLNYSNRELLLDQILNVTSKAMKGYPD